MKHLIVVGAVAGFSILGALVVHPFIGVAGYYLFALFQPQILWEWSLPPGIRWSLFLALATMVGAARFFLLRPDPKPWQERYLGWCKSCHVWLILFALWTVVCTLESSRWTVAGKWIEDFLKIIAMWITAAIVARKVSQLWFLLNLAAVCFALLALHANTLYLFEGRNDFGESGFGGFDNNYMALLFAMAIPLQLTIWETSRSFLRWVMLFFIAVNLHAIFLAGSRGALVALLAAAPIMFLRSRQRQALVPFGMLFLAIVPILAGRAIRDRFNTISEYDSDSSAQSRFQAWGAAWAIAVENPVFGVGMRNSDHLLKNYGLENHDGKLAVHNQYLQVIADTGFPGLALYLILLISVWRRIRRATLRVRQREDREADLIRALSSGVERAMAVYCVGAVFLTTDVVELPYMLLLIGAQLPTRSEVPEEELAEQGVVRPRLALAVGAARIDA